MQRTLRPRHALAAAALLAPAIAGAQDRAHVFRGARILPISGAPIDSGVLVVRGGRIVAVGRAGAVRVPDGAEIHDVAGRTIMPGLVDTHSHIGGGDGGDQTAPMHPDVRLLDALDARDDGIQRAQAGGLTTVNVMPGSGLLMSGQTVYLKLRDGGTVNDILYCADPTKDVCGGMKMANGTNPRRPAPHAGTRARAAAVAREKFVKAQDYRAKTRAAKGDASKLPTRDLEMDALVEVLEGRRIVHFHSHRHDDILTAVRLSKEFGFKLVLQHGTEAYKVAGELAKANVPASIIMIDTPGGKLETMDLDFRNGAILDSAGVLTAFHTDDGITDSRFFLRSAALAVRAGMSRDKALYAMTMAGARMLGLENRVGTLEAGKDADFIILDGDPLSVYTHVQQTWVEGRKVFDLADPKDRGFALGGYGVLRDGESLHVHEGMEGHE